MKIGFVVLMVLVVAVTAGLLHSEELWKRPVGRVYSTVAFAIVIACVFGCGVWLHVWGIEQVANATPNDDLWPFLLGAGSVVLGCGMIWLAISWAREIWQIWRSRSPRAKH